MLPIALTTPRDIGSAHGGQLHAFGAAPAIALAKAEPCDATSLVLNAAGTGGYIALARGSIVEFGMVSAPTTVGGGSYDWVTCLTPGAQPIDIVMTSDSQGYVLCNDGSVDHFGALPTYIRKATALLVLPSDVAGLPKLADDSYLLADQGALLLMTIRSNMYRNNSTPGVVSYTFSYTAQTNWCGKSGSIISFVLEPAPIACQGPWPYNSQATPSQCTF